MKIQQWRVLEFQLGYLPSPPLPIQPRLLRAPPLPYPPHLHWQLKSDMSHIHKLTEYLLVSRMHGIRSTVQRCLRVFPSVGLMHRILKDQGNKLTVYQYRQFKLMVLWYMEWVHADSKMSQSDTGKWHWEVPSGFSPGTWITPYLHGQTVGSTVRMRPPQIQVVLPIHGGRSSHKGHQGKYKVALSGSAMPAEREIHRHVGQHSPRQCHYRIDF